jgi:hypothetical protein
MYLQNWPAWYNIDRSISQNTDEGQVLKLKSVNSKFSWLINDSNNYVNIGEGMKKFRKYQLAVWLSIQNFYSHFTTVTRRCECFGRIVEPWYMIQLKPNSRTLYLIYLIAPSVIHINILLVYSFICFSPWMNLMSVVAFRSTQSAGKLLILNRHYYGGKNPNRFE